MNLRLACDLCGSQPCLCVYEECQRCGGEGEWNVPTSEPDTEAFRRCPDCHGEGWIRCNSGGVNCPFDHCYCEAAWDRQQEANAAEPPISARERHELDWRQKQELRR